MLAALSLPLVAAQSTPTGNDVGTATTEMTAVSATVTGLGDVPGVEILDLETYASNDTDADRNVLGGGAPLARASVTPLRVGGSPIGAVTATSGGDGSARSGGATFGALGAGEALAAAVNPAVVTAEAGAERAVATVGASTAEVEALLSGVGVDLNVTDVTSTVTQDGASAVQGLSVGDLSLALGDLVPLDVLEQLPLQTILDLVGQLPVGISPQLDAVIAAIQDAVAAVESGLADVRAAADAITGSEALDDLRSALDRLADLEDRLDDLLALEEELDAVDTSDPDASLGDTVTGIGDAVTGAGDSIDGILFTLSEDCDFDLDTATVGELAAVQQCVASTISDLQSTIAGLEDTIDDLVAELQRLADALAAAVDDLATTVTDLLAALQELDGVLAELQALLPELAGAELLGVGAFDVGVNVVANESTDTSRAVFLCSGVEVRVLSEALSTPSCSEGLAAITPVLGEIDETMGAVRDVLATLPLSDVAAVGDLEISLFPDVFEEVRQDGGYVVARAGGTILDLGVPSVTIDPSQVTGLLPGLDLPDVLAEAQASVDEARAAVAGVGTSLLDDVLATIDDIGTAITSPAGLAAQWGLITDLLDSLDLGRLGSLSDPFQTPGLQVTFDPSGTAEFALAAVAGPTPAPAQPGAPSTPTTPTGAPGLPATGGGLALIGLVAIGAAALLRRR